VPCFVLQAFSVITFIELKKKYELKIVIKRTVSKIYSFLDPWPEHAIAPSAPYPRGGNPPNQNRHAGTNCYGREVAARGRPSVMDCQGPMQTAPSYYKALQEHLPRTQRTHVLKHCMRHAVDDGMNMCDVPIKNRVGLDWPSISLCSEGDSYHSKLLLVVPCQQSTADSMHGVAGEGVPDVLNCDEPATAEHHS
jgi:hypothetical protein